MQCNQRTIHLNVQGGRPGQGPPGNNQAVARMLQNMPSADYIARTLGMDQASVENLMRANQEGRSYLAQQLVQRNVAPGAGQLQPNGPQQNAGVTTSPAKCSCHISASSITLITMFL